VLVWGDVGIVLRIDTKFKDKYDYFFRLVAIFFFGDPFFELDVEVVLCFWVAAVLLLDLDDDLVEVLDFDEDFDEYFDLAPFPLRRLATDTVGYLVLFN
jgi:hypothetical protein